MRFAVSLIATILIAVHARADDATKLTPGAEVFAQYAYTRTLGPTSSPSWFHELSVPRAWAWLDAERGAVHGRVLIEGVRSASEGALLGVSGDSFVLRFREAWAGVKPHASVDVRVGMVPMFVVPFLDEAWRVRVLGTSQAESARLLSPADVGARARWKLPAGYGEATVSFVNGEGYTSRELNRGKTTEIGAAIVPLPGGALEPLTALLAWQSGSQGATSARADRMTFGVFWRGDAVRTGGALTYGWGAEDDGARRSIAAEGSVRVRPWSHLLAGARASLWARDTRVSTDVVRSFEAAVGWEIDSGAETWLAFVRTTAGGAARDALAGVDRWELRIALKAAF